MPRMLGDKILPEGVQGKRRQLRSRIEDLRDPIRQKRRQFVPGPNIVGKAESKLSQLRDKFVTREGALSRIKELRSEDTGSSDNTGSSNTKSKSNQTASQVM